MSRRRRAAGTALALLVGAVAIAAMLAVAGELGRPEGLPSGPPSSATIEDAAGFDPFAFEEGDPDEFLERGRDAYAHPLYAFSPQGAAASAARTARFRGLVEEAAGREGVDADTLEAVVMLESAGRPEVAAGGDPEGAVGLAQILSGTATGLLGMSVDLERSKRLTAEIERMRRRAARTRATRARRALARRVRALERRRRSVDERYDPERSLAGAARYLALAERRFGREDLAVASYHMGMGNLGDAIEAYVAPARLERTLRETVSEHGLSYVRLFYDSSPVENPGTHALLASLGDDSRSYLFRVEAAREIMALHRGDPAELARREGRHALWPSGEAALRPPEATERYADASALREAREDGDLATLPDEPARLGFSLDPTLGRLSVGERPGRPVLYRSLRPEALATLLFITKEVRRSAGRAGLRVTDAARDSAYGRRLAAAGGDRGEPAEGFDPHATGYAFDVARDYPDARVRAAFASVLDRLRALRVIDYVYERREIHVGVGPDAERLLPLQEALAPSPGS